MNYEYEYKRALIFLERKTTVHISTNRKISRNTYFWCNGLLMEVGKEFFVIKDRKDGKEHFILFSELKKPIEVFKEVKNE